MGTTDVRVDVKLNKPVGSLRTVASVTFQGGFHMGMARKRNNEEDAEEELYLLVTVAEDSI